MYVGRDILHLIRFPLDSKQSLKKLKNRPGLLDLNPEEFIRADQAIRFKKRTRVCFTRIKRDIDLTKISKTDLVILYATAFGNVAVRCEKNGSPFVQTLCRELQTRKKRTIYQDCYN